MDRPRKMLRLTSPSEIAALTDSRGTLLLTNYYDPVTIMIFMSNDRLCPFTTPLLLNESILPSYNDHGRREQYPIVVWSVSSLAFVSALFKSRPVLELKIQAERKAESKAGFGTKIKNGTSVEFDSETRIRF
ncbi:hypothetical protein EVAR_982_1 [Eumeta japonica]|uniref:Uncharacterized protein n=1 Tax=Eumeta variegata TaxID=151549 RepID=A0A4C1SGE4_EUMVA|nr:hypothetical protein EVAR_982_1 [Eumeta japonica]